MRVSLCRDRIQEELNESLIQTWKQLSHGLPLNDTDAKKCVQWCFLFLFLEPILSRDSHFDFYLREHAKNKNHWNLTLRKMCFPCLTFEINFYYDTHVTVYNWIERIEHFLSTRFFHIFYMSKHLPCVFVSKDDKRHWHCVYIVYQFFLVSVLHSIHLFIQHRHSQTKDTRSSRIRIHTNYWCNARWENKIYSYGSKKCYAIPSSTENICDTIMPGSVLLLFSFSYTFIFFSCQGHPLTLRFLAFLLILSIHTFFTYSFIWVWLLDFIIVEEGLFIWTVVVYV